LLRLPSLSCSQIFGTKLVDGPLQIETRID
jgi:uncharacterized membrane protein (UPF0182 family)